ncbi:DUF169 domain-containing protein [Thermodesulfobacteriota bacterium]
MADVKKFNKYGEELEKRLRLQTSPIAVKMLKSEADIPADVLRPMKDRNKHYAQCQAFSLSRRDRLAVAMLKEDNWCPGPVLAYGLLQPPDSPAPGGEIMYEGFEHGEYIGILSAPLRETSFEPDLVIIYSDTNQLRSMLLSLKEEEKKKVKSRFFPFSCAWSVTSPVLHNEYWITLPDPGEYVRALTQAGEMIFSIPVQKLDEFMEGLTAFFQESMFANEQMMMLSDFSQPDIYKEVFKKWNMEYEG